MRGVIEWGAHCEKRYWGRVGRRKGALRANHRLGNRLAQSVEGRPVLDPVAFISRHFDRSPQEIRINTTRQGNVEKQGLFIQHGRLYRFRHIYRCGQSLLQKSFLVQIPEADYYGVDLPPILHFISWRG